MPKKIDPALRERAVRLVLDHLQEYPTITAACEAAARRCGVGSESVRRWVRQAQVDAGDRPGATSEENAEIKRLKAENRRLREGARDPAGRDDFLRGGARLPQPLIVGFIEKMNTERGFAVESVGPWMWRFAPGTAVPCVSWASRLPREPTAGGNRPAGPSRPAR